MRRFAEIDSDGIVLRVIVADSSEWCEETLGGVWVETFKDRSQRFHYAGMGYTYDEERDAFIPPAPYPSWVLVEETCLWEAPVTRPSGDYVWDEESVSWQPAPAPFDSWVWNETKGSWEAPIPYPNDGNDYVWDEERGDWMQVVE